MNSKDRSLSNSSVSSIQQEQRKSAQPLLQKHSDDSSNSNIGKVIYFSIPFAVLFTAFGAFQGLLVQTFNEIGYPFMGEMTLLIQYVVTLVALFISPTVVKGWSYRFGYTFASLGFIAPMLTVATVTSCLSDPDYFWCSGRVMTYLSNVASGVGIGISAPCFWLSSNRCINSLSNEHNKGRYFGIFFSFISAAQIFGNILSYLVIQSYGNTVFFIVCGGFGVATLILLFFSTPGPKYQEEWEKEETVVKAKRILGFALNTKMKYLLPMIFFSSLAATLTNSFQYQIISNSLADGGDNQQDYMPVVIFIIQGFVGVLASYLSGKNLDRTAQKEKLLNVSNYVYDLAVIFSLLAYFVGSFALAYIMGSLWGIGIASSFAMIYAIVAKEFDATIEIFAVVQIAAVAGSFAGAIIGTYMQNQVPGAIFVVIVFLGASQVSTRFFNVKQEVQVKDEL